MSASTQSDVLAATVETIPARIESEVTQELIAADTAVAQQVQILNLVHQARLAQLTRTAADVTARYGAASPHATAAQAAVTVAQGISARVAALSRQVGTKTPQAAPTGWALYGHVNNAQLQPVSAYCVFLVDARNAYQSAYGFTYTDSAGYFLLSYAGTTPGAQSPAQPTQQPAGTAPAPPVPQPAPPAPAPQLFIEIANANGQPVYRGTSAFAPSSGTATYQSITLPMGEKPIGDPPAAIRTIALPPRKQSS